MAYHGTSGRNEKAIERNGVQSGKSPLSRKDLEAVAAVFDAMSWDGETIANGYSVLKSWSIGFDRANGPKVFLAESSIRASLYATRGYAGGEAMLAVQYCLADLQKYVRDPEVRRRHQQKRSTQDVGCSAQSKTGWVKKQLAILQPVAEKCRKIENQHFFGIVYAFRLTPSDLGTLKYSSMGLISSVPISPDRLLAKIRVPADL